MRLLQLQHDGSYSLVNRIGKNVPSYAILSHTWGADDDEVTFRDLAYGTSSSRTKAGYRKLSFCGQQAARDGLKFFWVDTCCIDKSSSAELSEAINSMFRWYRDAAKCYVYLEDVSADDTDGQSFQKSKWFTRGWTLQELLAPTNVEFFSTDRRSLGSRSSRIQDITETTRIPTEALQGRDLSHFTINERMRWAQARETTRDEDLAYSLLGIFDIQMPLIYGEGRNKAFKRLRREIEGYVGDGALEENLELRTDCFDDFVIQTGTVLQETNRYFKFLMGESNNGSCPDLIAVKRTGTGDRNIEVHVLDGDDHYQSFKLQVPTPLCESLTVQLEFALTDWDGDGNLDLVMIKKTDSITRNIEVHILSGASNYQTFFLQTETALSDTDDTFTFTMGRWNAGGRPDLFAIKQSGNLSNTTELQVLSGTSHFQEIVHQTNTGLPETDATFEFLVTDWDADGRSDLVAIRKSNTNRIHTEVHVLSRSSEYKDFVLRAETALRRSNGFFEFAVADWTRNGKPDLIAVKKRETGTNTTEVHVLAGEH